MSSLYCESSLANHRPGCFLVLKYLIHRCSQQSRRPFFKRKLWSVKRLCRRLPRNPLLARQTPSLLPFSPQITAKAQVMAMFSGVFADNSLLDGNAFICLGIWSTSPERVYLVGDHGARSLPPLRLLLLLLSLSLTQ